MDTTTAPAPGHPRPSTFERVLRRFVPSTSMLSYNPVFKAVMAVPSWLYSKTSHVYRGLPPN